MDNQAKVFCAKCGTKLINGVCLQCAARNNAFESEPTDKCQKIYNSPEEKTVAVLGKKYLENYTTNGIEKYGFAVLSNKRLYLRGKSYNVTERNNGSKNYQQTSQERSLDLRDIIGVGYEKSSSHKWFIFSLITPLLCLPVVFFMILFFRLLGLSNGMGSNAIADAKRIKAIQICVIILLALAIFWIYCMYRNIKEARTYITIQYTGGAVALEQKWYSESAMEKFRDSIYIAKDQVLSGNAKTSTEKVETVPTQPTQKASVADEISKLNELLAQGILSQEEFDKAKKELLGL